MPKTFGTREICKLLKKENFIARKKKATRHLIYDPPSTFKISPHAKYPFVTVLLGKREFDPITCRNIRSQLLNLGVSQEIIDKYLGY